MVTTSDPELAARIKMYALHGMSRDAWKRFSDEGYKHYQVMVPGFKYNMTDVAAAVTPSAPNIGRGSTDAIANAPKYDFDIKGLTAGVAFQLGECCHPVPGDRIVGLRRPGEGVEVHAIDCLSLANGIDADEVLPECTMSSATRRP